MNPQVTALSLPETPDREPSQDEWPVVGYFPENALLTTAAAGFGVPFSWNKP
jgi:hypothetical protein